jgi:hypothetical protein
MAGNQISLLRFVCIAEGRKEEAGSVCRVPAAEIETLVIGAIRSNVDGSSTNATDQAILGRYCEKVVIKQGSVELFLKHATDGQPSSISLRCRPARAGVRCG